MGPEMQMPYGGLAKGVWLVLDWPMESSLMGLMHCCGIAREVTGCGQRKGNLVGSWSQWQEKEQIRLVEAS